jgi:hypothetical protein
MTQLSALIAVTCMAATCLAQAAEPERPAMPAWKAAIFAHPEAFKKLFKPGTTGNGASEVDGNSVKRWVGG